MQDNDERLNQLAPEIRFRGFSGKWEKKKLGDLGSVAMNKGSPDQRVIIKTYVEKQAKNRRRIFSKLRNP